MHRPTCHRICYKNSFFRLSVVHAYDTDFSQRFQEHGNCLFGGKRIVAVNVDCEPYHLCSSSGFSASSRVRKTDRPNSDGTKCNSYGCVLTAHTEFNAFPPIISIFLDPITHLVLLPSNT